MGFALMRRLESRLWAQVNSESLRRRLGFRFSVRFLHALGNDVILGDVSYVAVQFDFDKKLGVTGMILQAGQELDAAAWLKKNRLPDTKPEDDEWAMLAEEAGAKVPKSKPSTKFSCVFDVLTNKPKAVTVALWPTTDGWAVPALMRYGGWNACPMLHVQVSLLRYWKEKYDAELVAIAGDVVELRVGKPPKTDAGALELAREQYSYCDDIVSQGTMSLERLAETLKNGTVWYFWWD